LRNDFFSDSNTIEVNETFSLDFNYEILNLKDTPFEVAPISVIRASSEKLQNLFIGNTIAPELNNNRLESFCKAYNRTLKIYKLPHPFN